MKSILSRTIGILIITALGAISCNESSPLDESLLDQAALKTEPKLLYGLPVDSFEIHRGTIQKNQFLSTLLAQYNVPYTQVDQLVRNSKDVFDVKKIRPGKTFTVLSDGDSIPQAEYFIYEKNPADYVVFCLGDSCFAYEGSHPIRTELKSAGGVINSSLYKTMQDLDLSPALAMEMSDLYAWTIDFYRIQKNDKFKVIYEELYVDTTRLGAGDIKAMVFEHNGEPFYAYRFSQDSIPDYFDEQGMSLKKAFLQAPLKFSRISSGFTKKRFHPVLKRMKAHLGTDYAAPTGTPILAVGDGTVSKSSFTNGNGKFVKIRHNSTYETQYLHMSKRAVKVGDVVRQGDVIGYVGSTGLATGPHVCFRFWKNGVQVDHRKEKFPPSLPIKDELKEDFNTLAQGLNVELETIEWPIDTTHVTP